MKNGLKKTEHLLWDLITAPEGVEKALREKPVELPVTGNQKLTAPQRLDIYANMYFYRIRDALKEDFPKILKILGEECFHNLITDYLIAYPPTHFSLRNTGENLATFLKKHRLMKKFPYLSELAQFEWTLIEAFDAADAPLLSEMDLKKVRPEKWASLQFKFVPSFYYIPLNWKMDEMDGQNKKLKKEKTNLRVWRKNLKVFFKPVDLLEAKLIRGVQNKKNFGELCRYATAPTMASTLMIWIKDEMLVTL